MAKNIAAKFTYLSETVWVCNVKISRSLFRKCMPCRLKTIFYWRIPEYYDFYSEISDLTIVWRCIVPIIFTISVSRHANISISELVDISSSWSRILCKPLISFSFSLRRYLLETNQESQDGFSRFSSMYSSLELRLLLAKICWILDANLVFSPLAMFRKTFLSWESRCASSIPLMDTSFLTKPNL